MHPNQDLIERFYRAFAARDHATMAACYAPGATFADPVFTLQGKEVAAMWHFLTENARGWGLQFGAVAADDGQGQAHWEADYRFSATDRPVHNVIEARFAFRDGRIVEHHDHFDFWRWSRQALGLPGTLLGWTPVLRNKVRSRARRNLDRFIAAHPEYR